MGPRIRSVINYQLKSIIKTYWDHTSLFDHTDHTVTSFQFFWIKL